MSFLGKGVCVPVCVSVRKRENAKGNIRTGGKREKTACAWENQNPGARWLLLVLN